MDHDFGSRALRISIAATAAIAASGTAAAALAATAATAIPAVARPAAATSAAALCDGPHQTLLFPAAATFDARAAWLDRRTLLWPGAQPAARLRLYHAADATLTAPVGGQVGGADGFVPLAPSAAPVPERWRYLGAGTVLALAHEADAGRVAALHRGQLLLVAENDDGTVRDATRVQAAGALDDLYAAAEAVPDLGATPRAGRTAFKLWAPTARQVAVCTYDRGVSPARAALPLRFDAATGVWSATVPANLDGKYYRYAVDVYAPAAGIVRNLVTDPYAVSLSADSQRGYIADLGAARYKPAGWERDTTPATVKAQPDMSIYELHVRDFSIGDATVSAAHRGKYMAFTESGSNGMRHLRALADAGLTDVHLLPVYDFGSVPEVGCATPAPSGAPDGEEQQRAVMRMKANDCYNWGYDPYHYNAPEGGYSVDPADGARRVLELRKMVMALHQAGLRVGMDVVYNHTYAAGQHEKSVLDRVVPGYYHRLDARGGVESSTCGGCGNTATEHRMMAKLMIDSAALWTRQYHIDSFRFDLMGHQPRAAMEALQRRVNAAAGRHVNLIGEGWNFGEVADGKRFVQASQLSLAGSGIGTFSDRARDAVRGGGAGDTGQDLLARQGYVNGLVYDPNGAAPHDAAALPRAADLVRVGLAGTLGDVRMTTHTGAVRALREIDYAGQPAGYASAPGEVVNYMENHDNQTLYDLNALRLPLATATADRARVQMLAAAINAFSQGVAYFHAGFDILRSKSLDRNSFDSGDWFNRLDWTYQDNFFGTGLPPEADNGKDYALLRPLLANPALKPAPADIAFARDTFRDLLRIRASSMLFRLRTAADVAERLRFHNTGPAQVPTLIAGRLDGAGYPGARFRAVLYLINVDKADRTLEIAEESGQPWRLHPVHLAATAADRRAREAHFAPATGRFTIPARTAVVFVQ